VALHHRDLPADQPLFVLRLREVGAAELRRLGVNAARLVKSEPLVLRNQPEAQPESRRSRTQSSAQVSAEDVDQIVQRILAELVKA
jgi:hypothetical protein